MILLSHYQLRNHTLFLTWVCKEKWPKSLLILFNSIILSRKSQYQYSYLFCHILTLIRRTKRGISSEKVKLLLFYALKRVKGCSRANEVGPNGWLHELATYNTLNILSFQNCRWGNPLGWRSSILCITCWTSE